MSEHSRPHVSNDNPFSESQFKTLKYRPEFPDRFASFDVAHTHCGAFFPWYNDEHFHSSLGLLTPPPTHVWINPPTTAPADIDQKPTPLTDTQPTLH